MPISTQSPFSGPIPNDVIFVVEGTALCGAYLNELKQTYIYPTLECFSGGHVEDRDCGSDSNYTLFGLVIFHSSDILPGYLTEAHGPITTPQKLMSMIDKIHFTGGYGEAASHVGEGLATALQCLQDLQSFRCSPPESPAPKKHIVLICNCKPYGLPVSESGGSDGSRGLTAEQLAALMMEKGIHLSIFSPRKIPALISLFDRAGGESSTQKTYARDPRHLVLLNGFHLQERPLTPTKGAPEPIVNAPPTPQSGQQQQTQIPATSSSSVSQSIPVNQAPFQQQHPPVPVSQQSQQPNVQQNPQVQILLNSNQNQPPTSVPQTMQSNFNVPPNPIPISQQNMRTPSLLFRGMRPGTQQNTGIQQSMNQPIMSQGPVSQQPLASQLVKPMNPQQSQMNPQLQHQLNQQQQQQMNHPMNPQQQNQQQQMSNIQLNQPSNQQQLNPQLNLQQQLQQQQQQQQQPQRWPNSQVMTQQANLQQQQKMQQQLHGQQQAQQQAHQAQQQQQQQAQQAQAQQQAQQQQQAQHQQQQQIHQQQLLMAQQSNNQQPSQPPQTTTPTGIPSSALQQQLQQQNTNSTLIAQLQNPPIPAQPSPQGANQVPGSISQMVQLPQPGNNQNQKERQVIWRGLLEWHEKQKGPPEGQKIPRQVPCQVSANVVNQEPEVKGDGWPQKLIMQLIPKAIVGSLGGTYFRDVKTVLFMLQDCDALTSLTRVMDSGFAGCVHFTGTGMQQPSCTIKVLILLYSKERHAYLGFIPNDQAGFVDRIRKVIQQQKTQQAVLRQTFPGGPAIPQQPQQQQGGGMGQPQPGLPGTQPVMGAISNQVSGTMPTLAQQLGQNAPGIGNPVLAQQLGQNPPQQPSQQMQMPQSQMQNPNLLQQQQQQHQQQQAQQAQQQAQQQQAQQAQQQAQQAQQAQGQGSAADSTSADLAAAQYEIERQQNLLKIQQLQQTLQQAQQRELQYQQLHSHPTPGPNQNQIGPGQQQQQQMQVNQTPQPVQQLQQQQQQPPQMQGMPRQMMTPGGMNQMRMIRPTSVSQANPGLKHLLQQQAAPNYNRMQNMQMQGMQQRMPGGPGGQMPGNIPQGGPPQVNQFEDVGILDLLK